MSPDGAWTSAIATKRPYRSGFASKTRKSTLRCKTKVSSAVFAASGDLGNFSGFRQGNPDYERAINIVHDAAIKAGVRLCGPIAWRDRPDFTCFQAGSETAAIAAGVRAELGPLANTQGKPEVGPFAVAQRGQQAGAR